LQAVDDHRPEHAIRIAPLAAERSGPRAPIRLAPALQAPAADPGRSAAAGAAARASRLQRRAGTIAGPERIEVAWWDFGDPHRPTVHRDYSWPATSAGRRCGYTAELKQPARWFLHGFFCCTPFGAGYGKVFGAVMIYSPKKVAP